MSRSTFLSLQRALVEARQARMRSYLEQTPELERYDEEYRKDVTGYDVPSYPEELMQRVLASNVVYVGDFHTLPHSQKFFVRLLNRLQERAEMNGRKVVCAMEAFPSARQGDVDRYLAAEISFDEMLDRVRYPQTWGFPVQGYREVLETCSRSSLPVLALNCFPRRREDRLHRRDIHAARLIARAVADDPECMVVVLIGDLHVARSHLPRRVEQAAQRRKVEVRPLIVYTNADTIYWQLARSQLEYMVNIVKLDNHRFCVINSTPVAKYDSYLRFVEGLVEDAGQDDEDFFAGSLIAEEQVEDLVRRIARHLGLPSGGLPEFELLPAPNLDDDGDSDLPAHLHSPSCEAPIVRAAVRAGQPVFLGRNLLLLHRVSLNHVADAAARLLLRSLGWDAHYQRTRDSFYYSVIHEALVYFGSKLINPKRTVKRETDLREWVRRDEREKSQCSTGVRREQQVVKRYVLPHFSKVRKHNLEGRPFRESTELYRCRLCRRMEAARIIGKRLGERLFYSARVGLPDSLKGKGKTRCMSLEQVAALWRHPPEPGTNTLELYLSIWTDTADVVEHHASRTDWF